MEDVAVQEHVGEERQALRARYRLLAGSARGPAEEMDLEQLGGDQREAGGMLACAPSVLCQKKTSTLAAIRPT